MTNTDVTYRGISFRVEYEYTRSEPMTYDYPGSPEHIEIQTIKCNGTDFTEFFLEYGELNEINRVIDRFIDLIMQDCYEEIDPDYYDD